MVVVRVVVKGRVVGEMVAGVAREVAVREVVKAVGDLQSISEGHQA